MKDSLLLVLPVPFCIQSGRLHFEDQACNGLERWAENFHGLTVACPLMPDTLVATQTTMKWRPVSDLSSFGRIEFVPLPWAYRAREFLRGVLSTKKLIASKIQESRYLSFAIGGMIGDWAAVACVEAIRQQRSYSVWTDRVETDVIRQLLPQQKLHRRWFNRCQLPVMERYHHWIIRKSSLGLFHGRDCYRAYAQYSRNPHCVHDIHLKASDQISECDLAEKCENLLRADSLSICYAGRMDDMKGPLDWVEIIHRLRQADIPVEATWFGDGSLRAEMQAAIGRYQLESTIRLPGFSADRPTLLREIKNHDIFLFCHKTPESPRCLIESLICGTPILGYESAYPKDLISQHGGGLLTPMNNIDAAVDAIASLNRDRNKLIDLSRAAAASGSEFNDEAVFRHRSNLIKKYL